MYLSVLLFRLEYLRHKGVLRFGNGMLSPPDSINVSFGYSQGRYSDCAVSVCMCIFISLYPYLSIYLSIYTRVCIKQREQERETERVSL